MRERRGKKESRGEEREKRRAGEEERKGRREDGKKRREHFSLSFIGPHNRGNRRRRKDQTEPFHLNRAGLNPVAEHTHTHSL